MIVTRVTLKLEYSFDLDSIPGWGTEPRDFIDDLRRRVNDSIPHYNPEIKVIDGSTNRVCHSEHDVCMEHLRANPAPEGGLPVADVTIREMME